MKVMPSLGIKDLLGTGKPKETKRTAKASRSSRSSRAGTELKAQDLNLEAANRLDECEPLDENELLFEKVRPSTLKLGRAILKNCTETVSRKEAAQAMGVLQDFAANPGESRAQAAYIPALGLSEESGAKNPPTYLPFAGERQLSFKRALDLLEQGREVQFLPFDWKKSGEDLYYLTPKPFEPGSEAKVKNFQELNGLAQKVSREQETAEIDRAGHCYQKSIDDWPQEGDIVYLPYKQEKPGEEPRPMKIQDAVAELRAGKSLTFQPCTWSTWKEDEFGEMEKTDLYLARIPEGYPQFELDDDYNFLLLTMLVNRQTDFRKLKVEFQKRELTAAPTPEPEEILGQMQEEAQNKESGRIFYQPYRAGTQGVEKIGYPEAYERLSQEQPVYFKPMLNKTVDQGLKTFSQDYEEGFSGSPAQDKTGKPGSDFNRNAAAWSKVDNLEDLQDFYRISRLTKPGPEETDKRLWEWLSQRDLTR